MKCVKCGWHIEEYPCFYCNARASRKPRSYKKLLFWTAGTIVVSCMVFAVISGIRARERAQRAYKANFVEKALENNSQLCLVNGMRYEYELNGADTLATNRCARRIVGSNYTDAIKYVRNYIQSYPQLRALAFEMVGLLGDEADAEYLIEIYGTPDSDWQECIRRIVQITARHRSIAQGGGEVSRFIDGVLHDRRYQECALKALAEFPSNDLSPYVEEILEATMLQSNAAEVLGILDLDYPYADRVIEVIVYTANGPQTDQIPEKTRTEEAIRWLTRLASDDSSSPRQKENAERYLAELELIHGTDACKIAYEAGDPEMRVRMITRAGSLFDDQRLELLEEALKDENMSVRLEAIRSLGVEYDGRAVKLLIGVMEGSFDKPEYEGTDWHEASRSVAAVSLGRTGATEAVPVLVPLLKLARPVCTCAYRALKHITMEDFGMNEQAYLAWYEQNKDR